jgi:hypothetical protein
MELALDGVHCQALVLTMSIHWLLLLESYIIYLWFI